MSSVSQRAIFPPALARVATCLLWWLLPLMVFSVRAGQLGAAPDAVKPSSEHYILTKIVIFNPSPGEESTLDGKFMDMAGQELSSRIEIRSSNDFWSVKECGPVKSCEVVSIEVSQDPGAVHYTALTKLINPSRSDAHAPLKLTADCPMAAGESERDLLNDCHVPQIREFARELASHDQSKHRGNL